MGIIDKTTYRLTCPQCGAAETANVLDKGSNWQSGATFKRFETSWSGGGSTEPDLISATCKQCGVAAQRSAS
ncbi:MAG: hypothetical protein WBN85_05060 [Candidatus Macondimonas sp.]